MSGLQETAISIGHCVWERESVLNHRGRTSKQARAEQPALLLPSPSRFSAPSRPSPRGSSSGSTVSFIRSTGVLRPDIGPNSLERQDYPVNNAPNLPPRSISLLLLRNFLVADRLQPCSSLLPLLFFSFSLFLSLLLLIRPFPSVRPREREQLLRVRPRNGRGILPSLRVARTTTCSPSSERCYPSS